LAADATGPDYPRVLQLRAISKSFRGVRVLEAVHFDVRPGEVHALVGENGAGKSTLMNIAGGVIPADSGQILWNGRPVLPRSPRHAQSLGIATVHQELALVPQLSAAENIFLGRHPAARGWVRWREIHARAAELLAQLGRIADCRRPAGELSLAERQLVEIARALAFDARLIVMDEPTAPLSERDAAGLFQTIRRIRDRGVAVVFISHRLKEIFQVSDRVTVLRDGRHVLTAATADTTQDTLVRAMVGTELKDRFAPRPAAPCETAPCQNAPCQNEEALRVEGTLQLAVRRGEIVGLAGLAGAGRTELLESLFGRGAPRPERLFVRGRPAAVSSPRDAIRHGIALVPDDRKGKGLVTGASLQTNIVLAGGRRRFFLRNAAEKQAANQLIGELRIKAASLDEPIICLSGGNQQKAVLAKWLYAGADVFLLDDPTRGIDVRSKAEIYDLIRALAKRGAAVLFASSELDELLRLADRIVVMHRGRIAGELAQAEATEERIMHLATGGAE
jgi:ribose transport system ATP-binding protein